MPISVRYWPVTEAPTEKICRWKRHYRGERGHEEAPQGVMWLKWSDSLTWMLNLFKVSA